MAQPTCATHAQSRALYQCDGCGKLLCDACIEESHRLLLCRLCGERALPLAPRLPPPSRSAASRPGRSPPRGPTDSARPCSIRSAARGC